MKYYECRPRALWVPPPPTTRTRARAAQAGPMEFARGAREVQNKIGRRVRLLGRDGDRGRRGDDRRRLLLLLLLDDLGGLSERHLVHLLDDGGGHVLDEGLDALRLGHLDRGHDLLLR